MQRIDELITDLVRQVLDSMNAGVYLTDTGRRILLWNKAAERIMGHRAADVIGRPCSDRVFQHVDQDGRPLCTTSLCPLNRAIVTGRASERPIIIYARTASGARIPLSTMVSPLRDDEGNVIGGVEVFRDESEGLQQMELARFVQRRMLPTDLPVGDRISFAFEYAPVDLIGGDFCHVEQLSEGVYDMMIADVAGHGVAAALYTALLHSMVHECADSMGDPARFLSALNTRLFQRMPEDEIATALAATIDCQARTAVVCSAGHPPALVQGPGGSAIREVETYNLPLGVMEATVYSGMAVRLAPGERILTYTDGALEIRTGRSARLGRAGVIDVISRFAPADGRHQLREIYEALVARRAAPDAEDDITLLSCILA